MGTGGSAPGIQRLNSKSDLSPFVPEV
jgi:hypothetical protein